MASSASSASLYIRGGRLIPSSMLKCYDLVVSMRVLPIDELIKLIMEYGRPLEWLTIIAQSTLMFVWSPFDERIPSQTRTTIDIQKEEAIDHPHQQRHQKQDRNQTIIDDNNSDEEIVDGQRWKRFQFPPPNILARVPYLGNGCVINDTLFVRSSISAFPDRRALLQLPRLSYHIQNTPHNGIIGVGDWKLEKCEPLDIHHSGVSTTIPNVKAATTTNMESITSPTTKPSSLLWLLIGGMDFEGIVNDVVSSYDPLCGRWCAHYGVKSDDQPKLLNKGWSQVVTYAPTNQCYLFDEFGPSHILPSYNYVSETWHLHDFSTNDHNLANDTDPTDDNDVSIDDGSSSNIKIGRANACLVPNGILCINQTFTQIGLLDPQTMKTTRMPSSWCWTVPKDDYTYRLTADQIKCDKSLQSMTLRRSGDAGIIRRVQPYSIYDHSIIISLVSVSRDFEDVHRVIWMDYINEPGRWYNGPPLKRYPRLIVSAQQTI
jgi:hypothetical protein